jgi:hypothetical protein
MAPLLNATTPAPSSSAKARSLPALRTKLKSAMRPEMKAAVDSVVTAGLKILYSRERQGKTRAIYKQIQQGGFSPQQLATGMMNLMTIIFHASGRKAPLEALYPAGAILLTYVLEDLHKTHGLAVTDDLISQVSKLMFQLFQQNVGQSVNAAGSQTGATPPGMPPGAPPGMPQGAPPGMPPPAPSPLLNRGM